MLTDLLFRLATKDRGRELRSWTIYKLACWLYKHGIQ